MARCKLTWSLPLFSGITKLAFIATASAWGKKVPENFPDQHDTIFDRSPEELTVVPNSIWFT